MIFAAFFEKWEPSLLIAFDSGGLAALTYSLQTSGRTTVPLLNLQPRMKSIGLEINIYSPKNILSITGSDVVVSLTPASSLYFMDDLWATQRRARACHHFIDIDWDCGPANIPILISKDEYF